MATIIILKKNFTLKIVVYESNVASTIILVKFWIIIAIIFATIIAKTSLLGRSKIGDNPLFWVRNLVDKPVRKRCLNFILTRNPDTF